MDGLERTKLIVKLIFIITSYFNALTYYSLFQYCPLQYLCSMLCIVQTK